MGMDHLPPGEAPAIEGPSMDNSPTSPSDRDIAPADRLALLATLAPFQRPSTWRSVAQLGSTALAYAACVVAMYGLALHVSVWLAAAIAVPAAGLMVRLFIIQHDCGHGSYFRSRRANEIVGLLCGLVTFTPFANWRRQHAGHHAVWNNLDQRHGGADFYSTCLTLDEYARLSAPRRFLYRLLRHPAISHLLLPPLVFLVVYRLPLDAPKSWRRERRGVHLTNLGLAALLVGLGLLLGWGSVALVELSTVTIASICGVWLFNVQHRFEDTEWLRQPQWTRMRAALNGSSYLRLPRVLQWFSGNIGFHHVHHLLPRVPNYRLQACHEALLARVGAIRTLTLFEALRAPSFALWDEANARMVPFPRAARAARGSA